MEERHQLTIGGEEGGSDDQTGPKQRCSVTLCDSLAKPNQKEGLKEVLDDTVRRDSFPGTQRWAEKYRN